MGYNDELISVARALVAPGKGILAADESSGTIEYISGVILYDETIRQKSADGTLLVQVLNDAGIMPGIKVDTGAKALPGSPNEMMTEGLDGLRERFAEYRSLGAKFSKWRA